MKLLELMGHHNHPHHMDTQGSPPMNVVVDKIQEVKDGKAKGVVVYGYMTGCPHCIRYDGVWSEACNNCPKGVFTYKIMMEDFPQNDRKMGPSPRSFPTIYAYTRTPNGKIVRKDLSQHRDEIHSLMEELAKNGSISMADGEEEILDDDEPSYSAISTPTRFPRTRPATHKRRRRKATKPKEETQRKPGRRRRKATGKKKSTRRRRRNSTPDKNKKQSKSRGKGKSKK